jgi:hypothetical protein
MEEERQPLDLRAEPALEPLGPREADVAERSGVVAPDRDGQRVHTNQATGGTIRGDSGFRASFDTVATFTAGGAECRFARTGGLAGQHVWLR